MKHIALTAAMALLSLGAWSQTDSTLFRGYFENREYDVYLRLDLYAQNIVVPGQDYYGALPGYLGKVNNPFCWLFVSARLKGEREALLSVVNDYGSEDLEATLTAPDDSTLLLRQDEGSTIKVPRDRKWQKLPKTIAFRRVKGRP